MTNEMRITFTVEDAAFFDEDENFNPDEVAGILMRIARKVKNGDDGGTIHDTNGNRVGEWSLDIPEKGED